MLLITLKNKRSKTNKNGKVSFMKAEEKALYKS